MRERKAFIAVTLLISLCAITAAGQTATSFSAEKKKHVFNEEAPQKGCYWSAEWNGQYGGTRNYVDHTHFGIHFVGNLLNRNAVHINAGYLFNPYLYLGGGTGIEYQDRGYSDYTGTANAALYVGALWVVPVYAEVRGYLLNKPTTPFLQLRIGYAASIYAAEKHFGFYNSSYNNICIGVRIQNHLSLTLGYLFMYQPAYLTGYDRTNYNKPIVNRSNPYEHYCTVGVAVNLTGRKKRAVGAN